MKNLSVFLNLDEKIELDQWLQTLGPNSDINLNLVHIFEQKTLFNEFVPFSFPPKESEQEIQKTVESFLERIASESKLAEQSATVKFHCLFSSDPKMAALDFIKNNNIELAVSGTRPHDTLEAIFRSSFSNFLLTSAPCDVLIHRLGRS